MDDKNIRKYAELMCELGLTGLEVDENGAKLRLERNEQAAAPAAVQPTAAGTRQEAPKPQEGCAEVTSPMVGVFYAGPSEDAQPFVRVGDTVRRGDVLCIIEAMKLMNEVKSEFDGEISDICVGNSQVVDYGHILFRIKKSESI